MKSILSLIVTAILLSLISCEKDFAYDEDCSMNRNGGDIGGWIEPTDSTLYEDKDSTTGNFDIRLNEWDGADTTSIQL